MQNQNLTGSVRSIESLGKIQGKYGEMDRYRVTITTPEDALDVLTFNAKGEFKRKVGDTIVYKKDARNGYGQVVYEKPQAPQQQGYSKPQVKEDTQTYIIRQSMLKAAIDFHVDNKAKTEHQIIETAKYFVNYVING